MFDGLDEGDFANISNLLVAHGVEHLEAQRFPCNLVKSKGTSRESVDFFEVYSRGGLQRAARQMPGLNVHGLEVLDLRSFKPDGTPWDFTRSADRSLALKMVREQRPKWIIAAPPCTASQS